MANESEAPVEAESAPEAPAKEAPKPPVPVDDSEEYVVDGKKIRLTRAQRTLYLQKAAAADKRLQEAAEKSKKADEWTKLLETDFDAALKARGLDPDKLISERMKRRLEAESLTEEQRAMKQLEQERDAYRKRLEETEKEAEERQVQTAYNAMLENVQQRIVEAADKYGLPSDPDTLIQLMDIGIEYTKLGVNITPTQLVEEYMRREMDAMKSHSKRLFSKLKGSGLLEYLGDDILKEIEAAKAAKNAASLKKIPTPEAKKRATKEKTPVEPRMRHISEAEFSKKFIK